MPVRHDGYAGPVPGLPPFEQRDFGVLVAVVAVVDCVPLAEVEGDPFAVGPWCWLLSGARRCWPMPYTGKVSLFSVPDQLLEPPGLCGNAPGGSNGRRVNGRPLDTEGESPG